MQNWFSAPRFRGVLVLSLLNIHLSYFWNLKFYDYDSPWELNKCLVKNDEIVHNSQTQLEQVFQSGWCFGFPTVGKTSSWSVVGRTWRTTPSFWLFTPGSSFDLQELVVNSSTRRKYFFFLCLALPIELQTCNTKQTKGQQKHANHPLQPKLKCSSL